MKSSKKNSRKFNGFWCPLNCRNCVVNEQLTFNKKYPDFPNSYDRTAECEFRRLAVKIENCEEQLNDWKLNGNDTDLRELITSAIMRLLKKKPVIPISFQVYQNLEQLRADPESLSRVAQFLQIEPKKLKRLL